jgi:hypothetical protein
MVKQFIEEWSGAIQAIVAIVSLLLAIILMSQKKRIGKLQKIITEIRNQNTIMTGRLDLERRATVVDRSPYFVIEADPVADGTTFTIDLRNIGIYAFNVTPEIKDEKPDYTVKVLNKKFAVKGDLKKIEVTMPVTQPNQEQFDFILKYESHFGKGEQRIIKRPGAKIKIIPPKD